MYCAVIDVGSNSVRLLVQKNGKTEYKNSIITGLAKNTLGTNVLCDDAIERTLNAVSFFVDKAKSIGANKVFCFATAAVRNASNKLDFVKKTKDRFDIDLDVVSGDKEAFLGLLGALNGKDGGIIDIGGASTEIIVSKDDKIIYKKSLPIGCVKITDICGQDKNLAINYCSSVVSEFGQVPLTTFTGIGGTNLSASAINLGLENYDSSIIDGSTLYFNELEKILDKVYSLPVCRRNEIKGLQKGREEVIGCGLIWLSKIMQYLKLEKIYLSEKDNLEGYILSLQNNE